MATTMENTSYFNKLFAAPETASLRQRIICAAITRISSDEFSVLQPPVEFTYYPAFSAEVVDSDQYFITNIPAKLLHLNEIEDLGGVKLAVSTYHQELDNKVKYHALVEAWPEKKDGALYFIDGAPSAIRWRLELGFEVEESEHKHGFMYKSWQNVVLLLIEATHDHYNGEGVAVGSNRRSLGMFGEVFMLDDQEEVREE